MTVYMDTSVILRRLLGEPDSLQPWGGWERIFTSVLTHVEYFRVIDRLRLESKIDDVTRAALQESFSIFWQTSYRVPLADSILARAALPFPTIVGSLDALHLTSALAVRSGGVKDLTVLTHDKQLGRAAVAVELPVLGVTITEV
jgi:predicted nucleic acid-binding protein